jgi:outer membrane protein assembly factor BamA
MIISSCSPTKYVPEGETLLDKNHIIIANQTVKKSDLIPFIKQKPNKEIFGLRFHLGLYNMSNIKKTRWPHSWLRNIGEEPVIYDEYLTIQSDNQLQSFLSSKGYFDATVKDTVETDKRKSNVYYKIVTKPAYTVHNLIYEIEDTNIAKLVYFDSINCVIARGKSYDVALLQAERSRVERFIKDIGFFNFTGDNIFFRVDSTVGDREVDIYYGIKKLSVIDEYNQIQVVPYSIYVLRNIYVYPDFVPKDALAGGMDYLNSLDTTEYGGIYFISGPGKPRIKYDLLIKTLYIKPDLPYNISNTELSQTHLSSLKTYRLVNVRYTELSSDIRSSDGLPMLDCIVQLTPVNQQSYSVELEGTNSSGNLGGALNLVYQHKNLFHGAEQFNIKLKGAYEVLLGDTTGFKSIEEYGIETSLKLPNFLMPETKKMNFISRYNPRTVILAAYNYQKMPVYTRTVANASFGYNWNAGNYVNHTVNPLQFNIVKLPLIDSVFEQRILRSSYLAPSYKDVLILGGNYIYVFSNQKIQKSNDYWYLKINAEAAGNLLSLGYKLGNSIKTDGSYTIFGQPFAQYIKSDIDLRYNLILDEFSSLVYRGFIGAGIPYGNSKAMPFAKQYFGGGANGIRAWRVRTLGPGSSTLSDSTFLNQTADIKIEANAEYRFKLFWILEGAVFLDAGNIWTYHKDVDRPGSQFKFNKFIGDMAIGTGLGLRFDLSFVLLRTDLGIKLRDPQLPDYPKWIKLQRPYDFNNNFTFVLGIGYPF